MYFTQVMAKKKENRGRKALNDKKQVVRLYIKESIIKKVGGYPEAQEIAESAIIIKAEEII